MAKHKSPSVLKSRLLRVNVDTYLVVKDLSQQLNITMAEALDKLITGLKPEPKPEHAPVAVATKPAPVTFSAQIPLPVTMAELPAPVVIARVPVIPNVAANIRSTSVKLRVTVAGRRSTNGSKQM